MSTDPTSTDSDFYCDQVLSGRTQVDIVAESEQILAFHHTRPSWPVHIVVIPKQHIASLTALSAEHDDLALELLDVVRTVASLVVETHGGARVITNLGAYQDSKHLHWHIVSGEQLER